MTQALQDPTSSDSLSQVQQEEQGLPHLQEGVEGNHHSLSRRDIPAPGDQESRACEVAVGPQELEDHEEVWATLNEEFGQLLDNVSGLVRRLLAFKQSKEAKSESHEFMELSPL